MDVLRPVLDIKGIFKTIKHTDGLLAAIDIAIKRDKKIIDAFIKENEYASANIQPVTEELFNRTKAKIETYRKKRTEPTIIDKDKYPYIDIKAARLSIENITHFQTTTISFEKK